MAEAEEIENLYQIIEDKRSRGEELKEMTARVEEAKSPGTSALIEQVDLLKMQLKFTEEDRQRQIMIQKKLKSKMEETRLRLNNNYDTISSDFDLFLRKFSASKKSAQTEAVKVSELERKVAKMADSFKQQTNTASDQQARIKHLEEERDVLMGRVRQSPDTSALMEQVDLLKTQLKVSEEKRKQQIMTQKNLKSKLEETTVCLKTNYDTILSEYDFYRAELAASKKLAQTEALKASELEQTVAMMTDSWIQQAHTNDDLQAKIERLEDERDMLLSQTSNPVKKRTSRSVAKSLSNFLLPVQRSRQEATRLPVADQNEIAPEVTPVKRQEKRKTRGFKLKRLLCCCSN